MKILRYELIASQVVILLQAWRCRQSHTWFLIVLIAATITILELISLLTSRMKH